jgi:hypothetical protein
VLLAGALDSGRGRGTGTEDSGGAGGGEAVDSAGFSERVESVNDPLSFGTERTRSTLSSLESESDRVVPAVSAVWPAAVVDTEGGSTGAGDRATAGDAATIGAPASDGSEDVAAEREPEGSPLGGSPGDARLTWSSFLPCSDGSTDEVASRRAGDTLADSSATSTGVAVLAPGAALSAQAP